MYHESEHAGNEDEESSFLKDDDFKETYDFWHAFVVSHTVKERVQGVGSLQRGCA